MTIRICGWCIVGRLARSREAAVAVTVALKVGCVFLCLVSGVASTCCIDGGVGAVGVMGLEPPKEDSVSNVVGGRPLRSLEGSLGGAAGGVGIGGWSYRFLVFGLAIDGRSWR